MGRLQAARSAFRRASGAREHRRPLDLVEAEDVALDVNARGDVVLAWEGRPSPPGRQTVVVSTRRGNGPFSPPVELVRGASSFDAGMADDGEVLVAVTVPEGDESSAEVMRGTVDEPAFTRRRVEGLTGIEDLTVAGDGSALLAGVTARYGELVVVRRRSDGSLRATDLVAQRSADGGAAVAGGPTGDGVAVWRDYSSDRREASLLVRPFGPEGFWPIERLGVSDYEPALARTGAATAIAWRRLYDVMLGFVGPGGRLASPRVVDRARRGATFEPGAPPVLIPGPGDRTTVSGNCCVLPKAGSRGRAILKRCRSRSSPSATRSPRSSGAPWRPGGTAGSRRSMRAPSRPSQRSTVERASGEAARRPAMSATTASTATATPISVRRRSSAREGRDFTVPRRTRAPGQSPPRRGRGRSGSR